ncbi:MAG: carbamoyltransferase HypF [Chloroflexota bacterium]|jgi:hydrogenase maturation protein HypF
MAGETGNAMTDLRGAYIHITGVVQGVGFRPFVYSLAQRQALSGWVCNTSSGVEIEVDGTAEALAGFTAALQTELPPLARIDSLHVAERATNGFSRFEIRPSRAEAGAFQPISPDVATCDDCLRELLDPTNRRFRYPFINCTNCGPRFTIIRDIPYDRPLTTMADFPLCDDCAAEYHDPLDRRFHAQPVACPRCGPHVWLETTTGETVFTHEAAIQATRRHLSEGGIVAVKGLGGFHLACDANDSAAVSELRRRKLRVDKPFAVMLHAIDVVRRHCYLSPAEEALLLSWPRPIVILSRRADSTITPEVAPGQNHIGVMLPYTPLHYLLLEPAAGHPEALVMTSGNVSEEPIAFSNEMARARLASLADAFLLHNRDIHTRCDDSVMRVLSVGERAVHVPLRRSRGYAPFPVRLPAPAPSILATGAELKNTFCLTRDHYAFLSHHIGDMENYETLCSFEEGIAHMESLFRIRPQAIAYDLHPDYIATRYALERAARENLPAIGVQHHHAHIAAGMAEHGLTGERPVIGVAFDGTGYGDDGSIWGGEFLIADYSGYHRATHLRHVPLPGGDKAVREPWRAALAWLDTCGLAWEDDLPPVRYALERNNHLDVVRRQIDLNLNAPLTSSMGRLFDAAAVLAGMRPRVNYEAQASIEFEASVDPAETTAYDVSVTADVIDPTPLWEEMVADWRAGTSPARIAARFHNGIARMVLAVCRGIRAEHAIDEVLLSGGVWQNMTLLRQTLNLLQQDQFTVYSHTLVPPNDGGLAVGQAAVAAWRMMNEQIGDTKYEIRNSMPVP